MVLVMIILAQRRRRWPSIISILPMYRVSGKWPFWRRRRFNFYAFVNGNASYGKNPYREVICCAAWRLMSVSKQHMTPIAQTVF